VTLARSKVIGQFTGPVGVAVKCCRPEESSCRIGTQNTSGAFQIAPTGSCSFVSNSVLDSVTFGATESSRF
jgi:hypothetical protein